MQWGPRFPQKSPVRAYQALEKPGQKWHIHGYLTLIGCYLLMMFYTTVAGWMLHYFYMTATGKLVRPGRRSSGWQVYRNAGRPRRDDLLDDLRGRHWASLYAPRACRTALERVTKVMMIALLVIMVVLAVNSMFMPGAKEGLSFYLVPDFARMQEVGRGQHTGGSAMNQAFFHPEPRHRGAMSIFGSYIGKEHSLLGESARIVVLDTFVAIIAGVIIFPACFHFGVDQTAAPA